MRLKCFALNRQVAAFTLVGCLLVSGQTQAATYVEATDPQDMRPGIGAMIGDALVVRPLMLATTAVGTVVFLASAPFTILGGKAKEAANTLVVAPANQTFTRCLGCTTTQDEFKNTTYVEAQKTPEQQQ